jgi:hypothetical protein
MEEIQAKKEEDFHKKIEEKDEERVELEKKHIK